VNEQLNIFGEHSMQRSAVFDGGNRLELRRSWGPGPTACVIGHNPSDAGADREDPTSRWWNAWFQLYGFGGYSAVNLYPWVTSDPRDVYEIVRGIEGGVDWGARDDLYFTNLSRVAKVAKAADQVFVCWGAIARDDVWIEAVIEEIQCGVAPYPDLWCWGTTQSGAPKHPMARGKHRIPVDQKPILWRAA
jgi:hypothetical protein